MAKVSFRNQGGDALHKRRGLLSCDLVRGLKFNGHLPIHHDSLGVGPS